VDGVDEEWLDSLSGSVVKSTSDLAKVTNGEEARFWNVHMKYDQK